MYVEGHAYYLILRCWRTCVYWMYAKKKKALLKIQKIIELFKYLKHAFDTLDILVLISFCVLVTRKKTFKKFDWFKFEVIPYPFYNPNLFPNDHRILSKWKESIQKVKFDLAGEV